MRPATYVQDIAEQFGVHPRSAKIVDRTLSEHGLRRKGSGRTIPDQTLREKLMMILAVNLLPDEPLLTVGEATRRWSELPSIEGSGRLFQTMQGLTLIEALEWLCGVFAEDQEQVPKSSLELNKTLEVATISFGREHVSFATDYPTHIPKAQTIRRISGLTFADLEAD